MPAALDMETLTRCEATSGILVNWSLNVTPRLTVTPLDPTTKKPTNASATTLFQIGFPLQQLSGTYTIQLGPTIEDHSATSSTPTRTRDLACLRDQGQNNPTTTVLYTASDLPKAIRRPRAGRGCDVHDRRARQFRRSGRYDDVPGSAAFGFRSISPTPTTPIFRRLCTTTWARPSQVAVPLFTGVGSGIKHG